MPPYPPCMTTCLYNRGKIQCPHLRVNWGYPMFKRSMWSMWLWSGVLFATIASTSMAENNHPINGIVAVVNEQLITRADFQKALDQAAQPYYRSHTPLPDAKLFRQKTLDALINRMLVLQLAAQNHVTISDQELQASMGRIAAQNHLTVA